MAQEIQLHTPTPPPPPPPQQQSPPPSTSPATKPKTKTLTLLPLVFIIYFQVSGGPYGAEDTVHAAGPLLSLVGFLLLPFLCCLPEALITSELTSAFSSSNSGFVLWAFQAFNSPFTASFTGFLKLLSSTINSATFPNLCSDYLSSTFPSLASGVHRSLFITILILLLSFINFTGLDVVGYFAIAIGIISLLPFVLMTFIATPAVVPARWTAVRKKIDWGLYLNTLFWNLNYWDNASTLAGEVQNPQRTFPAAMLFAGVLTCVSYFVPLLAVTGALSVSDDRWSDGFFAEAAGMIGGKWLKIWTQAGAVLSAIGLYEAQLSSNTFQLLGMAELGLLPKALSKRSKWFNTPWLSILISTLITLSISFLSFSHIIASANFLYNLAMLIEFAAFIRLRIKFPELKRPYKVPMGTAGVIGMCAVPSVKRVF
ncbi:probable polyamine transporter At3g13620 [Dioscorea cayenensis subsp. rotundata]|uniref:Polyamine transporter PUT1 n=1 Tax=Dioscorea cayennensis subsp. rotundata TaxID=55577 RepID=A0AB40C962_DIOCR|nr:probable polyamine transporter At3g13620 [Dioscorea cayenensis subsp. rotundata]